MCVKAATFGGPTARGRKTMQPKPKPLTVVADASQHSRPAEVEAVCACVSPNGSAADHAPPPKAPPDPACQPSPGPPTPTGRPTALQDTPPPTPRHQPPPSGL